MVMGMNPFNITLSIDVNWKGSEKIEPNFLH